ncbi:NAD(P)H-binding protein [Dyella telluris]|uniref:NAD(P)H-binding protein n=1 Tax=Dyella telluris TaxID=2763498 RepID=A0A7G8Q2S9_9GAMM|nr:NAD(P)H-binding protein [Dyella telluris]QNK01087.1 NAD(P)H-binding protein [Dyella telluris]
MKIILFGASGMVGQGVLRECLAAPDVDQVLVVGRSTTGVTHPRLRELLHQDFFDYASIEPALKGYDACFFCLGVSAGGMDESRYAHLTYDLTLAAAGTLARLNPAMVFVYVSGAGTDSSEQGRSMWARVKGRTENALQRLPFRAVYQFRPGFIEPVQGERSKTPSYRLIYGLSRPLFPLLRRLFPRHMLSTIDMGRAMLSVVRHGAPTAVLEIPDIQAAARRND